MPVLAKFSVNLTCPTFTDAAKILSKNISGRFCYKNIRINLDFTEVIEELELKIKLPLRLKIQAFSFLNKYPSETQGIVIEVIFYLISLGSFSFRWRNIF